MEVDLRFYAILCPQLALWLAGWFRIAAYKKCVSIAKRERAITAPHQSSKHSQLAKGVTTADR